MDIGSDRLEGKKGRRWMKTSREGRGNQWWRWMEQNEYIKVEETVKEEGEKGKTNNNLKEVE